MNDLRDKIADAVYNNTSSMGEVNGIENTADAIMELVQPTNMLMSLIDECPDVTVVEVIHMILERQEYFNQEPHDVE